MTPSVVLGSVIPATAGGDGTIDDRIDTMETPPTQLLQIQITLCDTNQLREQTGPSQSAGGTNNTGKKWTQHGVVSAPGRPQFDASKAVEGELVWLIDRMTGENLQQITFGCVTSYTSGVACNFYKGKGTQEEEREQSAIVDTGHWPQLRRCKQRNLSLTFPEDNTEAQAIMSKSWPFNQEQVWKRLSAHERDVKKNQSHLLLHNCVGNMKEDGQARMERPEQNSNQNAVTHQSHYEHLCHSQQLMGSTLEEQVNKSVGHGENPSDCLRKTLEAKAACKICWDLRPKEKL